MSWQILAIKDVALGIYDGPHATPKESNAGPIFLGIKNITEDCRLDFSDIRHISLEEYSRWIKRVKPKGKDIVFSYEATLHRYAIIPDDFEGCLGRRMALIRPDLSKVDHQFLYYYLRSDEWLKEVTNHIIIGSTVDRIPIIQFPNFKIQLPPLPIQQKIASILSAYDELIENNLKRIRLLEEAAQHLYREWFVKFRFPGSESVEMMDGLPEGWERKKIYEVCDTIGGGTPSTKEPTFWDGGDIVWFSPTDLSKNSSLVLLDSATKITGEGLKNSSAKMLPPRTILMSSRATIGLFGIISKPCSTNQGFISIIPIQEQYRYYLLFNLINRKQEIINNANGSTFKEITKKNFREMDILIPSDELTLKFNDLADTFLNQVENLEKQNQKLKEARDILLPRLMNQTIIV